MKQSKGAKKTWFPLVVIVIQIISISTIVVCDQTSVDELQAWLEFKLRFNKSYATPREEFFRLQVFLDNKRYVDSFNTKESDASFVPGLNPLCDLTTDEINASRNGFRAPSTLPDEFSSQALMDQINLAFNGSAGIRGGNLIRRAWYETLMLESLDYRYSGVVSRVKDQGACGSCWAFATTGALESALALGGKKILLSEQNLVDCSRRFGNSGCDGGLMDAALRYVHDHGIMTSQDYPYEARDAQCRAQADRVVIKSRNPVLLPRGNESLLRLALLWRGPIPVAIDAAQRSFHTYRSGVYNERKCRSEVRSLNHAVLLIGFGTERGRDYWLLKNSWGRSWGDNGYIKIARNQKNTCGVASFAVLTRLWT